MFPLSNWTEACATIAASVAPGETVEMRSVRFRNLGCYPLTGAVESEATTLAEIIAEMRATPRSL